MNAWSFASRATGMRILKDSRQQQQQEQEQQQEQQQQEAVLAKLGRNSTGVRDYFDWVTRLGRNWFSLGKAT